MILEEAERGDAIKPIEQWAHGELDFWSARAAALLHLRRAMGWLEDTSRCRARSPVIREAIRSVRRQMRKLADEETAAAYYRPAPPTH